MEGKFKQATHERYWDLCNRQKLSSELELKRQHRLTNQLIELERHFNTLELNKFGDADGIQTSKRGFQSSLDNLVIKVRVNVGAICISGISSPCTIYVRMLGRSCLKQLVYPLMVRDSYKSPVREKVVNTPFNKEVSVFLAVKERSRRKQTSPVKSSEPETARRRRDSLDRVGVGIFFDLWQNLASCEPTKTTMKRIVLQEDRQKETASKSSLSLDKKHHQSKTRERPATTSVQVKL
ncbi:hypothetical protein H5410_002979 [Solanum commersonii]|uniref:Uncharacterized protein n=1 Tax=Solanum commersonii TaxID=4109 RepID=A0A9J6B3F5_SOLCO|nr:hypothetical protein H5410_002979 [Solanum commersonii]